MSAGRPATLPPGKTIGVLGGGQLGRMLAQAAQTLGYRVHVYEPEDPCPAGAVADREFHAPFDDAAALAAFARTVDVVTYEFENIPVGPLAALAPSVPLRPPAEALYRCQNRQREKAWLRAQGLPHAPYAEALDGDIASAVAQVGLPCVAKTADFGYDGKGQRKIVSQADAAAAAAELRGRRCVVEGWVDFEREISVVAARSLGGEIRVFPAVENIHVRHILDCTIAPARLSPGAAAAAERIAREVAERLQIVGLIAIELFLLRDGRLLVNEMAPRPHNSGHWSIDGAETSQFEQHVRAICGLPLGSTEVREPTVMINLLGDLWFGADGARREPNWAAVLAEPKAKLHLYGKAEPRPGRKMGHFTVRAADAETALRRADGLRRAL